MAPFHCAKRRKVDHVPDEIWDLIFKRLYGMGEYNLGAYVFNRQARRVVARLEELYSWPTDTDDWMQAEWENFE